MKPPGPITRPKPGPVSAALFNVSAVLFIAGIWIDGRYAVTALITLAPAIGFGVAWLIIKDMQDST